jgi:hypothetical protein
VRFDLLDVPAPAGDAFSVVPGNLQVVDRVLLLLEDFFLGAMLMFGQDCPLFPFATDLPSPDE